MEQHWGTTSSRMYLSVFHMAVAEGIPFLGHSVVLGDGYGTVGADGWHMCTRPPPSPPQNS